LQVAGCQLQVEDGIVFANLLPVAGIVSELLDMANGACEAFCQGSVVDFPVEGLP
jgi:hypothetical protein